MARFTETQVEQAKRTDLEYLLRARGEKLMPSGAEYRWVYRDGTGEHDSITIRGSSWFDHKRQVGGDAVGFLQEFDGLSFRGAVARLLGLKHTDRERSLTLPPSVAPKPQKQKELTLPPRAGNHRRVYAYLCKTRGIMPEVVTHFVKAGTLYEEPEHHNAVFIATDESGAKKGGMKKSTATYSDFKLTLEGSDTTCAFQHRGASGRVHVFEAAVDMLSFISLYPDNWQAHSYLTLDGTSAKPLLRFLEHNESSEVILCLDNDDAGRQATKRIARQLREKGYADVFVMHSLYKDWNEDLIEQTHIHDAPEPECTMTP